jgi:hypothetical protein
VFNSFAFLCGERNGSAGHSQPRTRQRASLLESNDAVNAVGPEDSELTFIVAAKVDQAAMPSAGAGQGNLVDRSNAGAILILEHDNRLACHRCIQSKAGEVNQLGCCRLRIRNQGLRLRIHTLIEAE